LPLSIPNSARLRRCEPQPDESFLEGPGAPASDTDPDCDVPPSRPRHGQGLASLRDSAVATVATVAIVAGVSASNRGQQMAPGRRPLRRSILASGETPTPLLTRRLEFIYHALAMLVDPPLWSPLKGDPWSVGDPDARAKMFHRRVSWWLSLSIPPGNGYLGHLNL
jgi:hypothetical protein